jgi:hypothetical protein
LTPFPAAIEPNVTGAERVGRFGYSSLSYSWAPESSVDRGRAILEPLLRLAETHKALVCDEGNCKVVVNAIQGATRQTLAICSAFGLAEQLGPPNNCEVIAFRIDGQWWIKIIDSASPPPQPKAITIYTLEVLGLPRASILASLDQALSQKPVSMSDRSVKRNRIMALAPRRFSQILSGGWFEWPQVLVQLDEEYQVEVLLDLLVNKQNTSDPADWHMPTDQQVDQYRKIIVESITQALNKVCVKPQWAGSATLHCAQFRTNDGSLVTIPEGSSVEYYRGPLDRRITGRSR